MLKGEISVLNRRLPIWALMLMMIGSAAAATAASLAAPYAKVEVAVSQTIVVDSVSVPTYSVDVVEYKTVGQGEHFKLIMMGQGNDYSWIRITLKNLAGTENIVKVYAVNVPEELKVKFADSSGSYELFDTYYAKITGGHTADVYMYVLIKPGTPQGTYEFTVRVEVLGG